MLFRSDLFEPVGRALGLSWPVLQWLLIALAAALVLYIVWRLAEPLFERIRAKRSAPAAPAWTPDSAQALALLSDADALAAAGDYDAATHLLLQRSVAQIAAARPDLVDRASTARDLAALPALGGAARTAFAVIAARVERCRFALIALGADDWQMARAAYAEFAAVRIGTAAA